MRKLVRWIVILQTALLLIASSAAQINRASISGVATDPQESPLANVDIIVTGVETSTTLTTRTNNSGFYQVTDLIPGKYTVRFTSPGFATLEVKQVEALAGKPTRIDAKLVVATVQEVVTVSASTPLVETGSANQSTTLSQNTIENVPTQGRDLQQLVFLIPGVNSVAGPPGSNFGFNSQYGTAPDPTFLLGSAVAVNGGQSGSNAWYLDGNLNISGFGENIAVNPSPDTVEEFQAITSGLSSEYGRTSGGVFSVVLKSGTGHPHGTLYEYIRNSATNAVNPFTRQNSNQLRYNNFGGTFGGPVYIPHLYDGRKRTFFFFSWDASILHEFGDKPFSVPTTAMRAGDFSEDPNIAQYGIFNPYTTVGPDPGTGLVSRQPLLNPDGTLATSIPANLRDPVAMFFINSYPAPNYSDPLSGCPASKDGYKICNNFLGRVASSQDPQNISVKVDHQLSDKSKLFVEWLYNPTKINNYAVPWTGPSFPWNSTGWSSTYPLDLRNNVIGIGHNYLFSPTLVNEFRISYSRQYITTHPTHPYPDSITGQSAVQAELKASKIPVDSPYPIPTFQILSPGYYSFGPTAYVNMTTAADAYTLIDNVTKIAGRHSLKFGFLYRLEHGAYESGTPTQLNFSGGITSDPLTGLGGSGMAQFMLGALSSGDGSSAGYLASPYTSWHSWGFYGQDDFRLTPRFTLNVGLRYDLFGYYHDRNEPMSNFCFTCDNPLTGLKGKVVYSGDPGFPKGNIAPSNKGDVAPRVNFAWSPRTRFNTVIRGGYDIYYTDGVNQLNAPGQSAVNSSGWQRLGNWIGSNNPSQCLPFSGQCVAWQLSDTTTDKSALTSPVLTNAGFPAQHRENTLGGAYVFTAPRHDPMVQTWNLELQQSFLKDYSVSVGYVGSHATHLSGNSFYNYNNLSTANRQKYQVNINENVPISQYYSGLTADELGKFYADPLTGIPATTLPLSTLLLTYPFFNGGIYNNTQFEGTSSYNGLNFRVQKHYSHGFSFIAAFTVSKKFTNSETGVVGSNTTDPLHYGRAGGFGGRVGQFSNQNAFSPAYQDPDNKKADNHVIAQDDIPKSFNLAATYELPVGFGRPFLNHRGLMNIIVGGWKLTGNLNASSGIPLAVTTPCSALQGSIESNCRPNLIGNPSTAGQSKSQRTKQWINPAAFEPAFGSDPSYWNNPVPTDPRSWTFGNAPVRLANLRAPGFVNLDSALAKDFHLSEAQYFEFRWEVFNVLNHPNLGLPNTGWCLPPAPDGTTNIVQQAGCQFGRITNVATDPRAMQFALKFHF
jgi:hypothetical protein